MRRIALLLASTALAVLLTSGVVWADAFGVRNTKDSGRGSLRQTITEANAHPGPDVIKFAPGVGGEIGLQSPLPALQGGLEIRGPGAGTLTVRRASADEFRIFRVARTPDPVTISGLTISNGHAPSYDNFNLRTGGGGVLNEGDDLTLSRVVISGNKAMFGAGIFNANRRNTVGLTIEDSVINRNTDDGIGRPDAPGGIWNIAFADVRVERSTISANTGPGIFNSNGWVSLAGSTVSANTEGGIYSTSDRTVLKVTNSTIAENEDQFGYPLDDQGGGIFNGCGTATVVNSTITANENRYTGRPGGGIFHAGCSPDPRGNDALFHLRGTIVAQNHSAAGSPDASGPFASEGYNLIGDASGATGFVASDLLNVRAGLDPGGLQFNGGRTKTVALTQDSRAVDAVREGCPPPTVDQRGVGRPQDGDGSGEALCDIGAYELEPRSP